jgi:hypothetical protein
VLVKPARLFQRNRPIADMRQQVHTNQMAVHAWQCRFRTPQIGSVIG